MIFRNDDISYGSNVQRLKDIREVFEKHNLKELYSVIPYGKTIYDGEYTHDMPTSQIPTGDHNILEDNDVCQFIIDSINRGHSIALHGWNHTRITDYSLFEIENCINSARNFLEEIFNTKIEYFVAPYNCLNDDVYLACNRLGLEILDGTGLDLEEAIKFQYKPDKPFAIYHSWRDISLSNLESWLS